MEISQAVADAARIAVIICGAILAGSLVGIAYHHRRLTSRLSGKVRIPAGTFVMPWWASLSWVLFVFGALLPHIISLGEEDLWTTSVVINLIAMLVGLWALWEARFRVETYLSHKEDDEEKEEEEGH